MVIYLSLMVIKVIEDSYFLSFGETYGHKKKEYRCTPTFVNLKSNTMKNTLQMYGLFRHLQECRGIKCVFVTLIIFYTFVLHLS